jgi:hypothetical protein
MPHIKTGRPAGRPPKKSPQVIARILKIARTGLPLRFAAQAGDIDAETLAQWRVKDPEFDRALSQARLAAVEEKWKLIQKAAEDRVDADGKLLKAGDWRSLAWSLERAHPSDFARPEVALAVQTNVAVAANGQSALELVVIRDLEYAGLRNHGGYTHHPDESVRDVEGKVVPEEVSGYLTKDGAEASGQIISESQAAELDREALQVRDKVKAMMEKYRPALGNGEKVREVAVVEPVVPQDVPRAAEPIITHKAGDEQSATFWKLLVSSDPQSLVARKTAIFAVRELLVHLMGFKAHRMSIDFTRDPVTVGDLFALLERLRDGAGGWQLAQKLGGY